jgi:4-hydroxy-tetrahydrodipicolinate reductase
LETIPVVIFGCMGRMGRLLARSVHADEGMRLVALVDRPDHPDLDKTYPLEGATDLPPPRGDLEGLPLEGSVVVDFSSPRATERLAEALEGRLGGGRPRAVIGTTGLSASILERLEEASRETAVLQDSNMSYGINVLKHLAREARRLLFPDFDLEIVETHHRHKTDAPSGTALALGRLFAEEGSLLHGRAGKGLLRERGEVGVHAQRRGGVVGEHALHFSSEEETVTLEHRAHARTAFVSGALTAVRFVHGRDRGYYSMLDLFAEEGP